MSRPADIGVSETGAPAARANPRIQSLQVLRFFAAALVLVGHAQHDLIERLPAAIAARYGAIPLDWGLGVDVFFVISGFIMVHLMRNRFGSAANAGQFLKRRLIRIIPLYWLCTTLVLATSLHVLSMPGGIAHTIASYLFVPWPHPDGRGIFPVLSLGWTLNYEMLFYTIFAVGVCLSKRSGVAVILAAFAVLLTIGQIAPESAFALRFWGSPLIGEFLLGMGLAWLHGRGVRLPRLLGVAAIILGIGVAIAFYQTHSYETISRLFTGGIPAIIIASGAVLGLEPRKPGALTALLVRGGDASYALYLIHPFVVKIGYAVTAKIGVLAIAPLASAALCIIAAIIASFIVYRWFEQPLIARLLAIGSGKSPAIPAASPKVAW
ncbi:polysaccharide biosynthesis acyltransferase UppZ [soil metagenome]